MKPVTLELLNRQKLFYFIRISYLVPIGITLTYLNQLIQN